MNIHYAVQVCDIASNQGGERYCRTDRTALSIKCISSLMESIEYVIYKDKTETVKQNVIFFDDNSTVELKQYLKTIKKYFNVLYPSVTIDIVELQEHGIMNSIKSCYYHLMENGTDLVYQVQDDYLYDKTRN